MTIPAPQTAFDDIIDFLAWSPSAEEIIAYQPPESLQQRMNELLEKNHVVTYLSISHCKLS